MNFPPAIFTQLQSGEIAPLATNVCFWDKVNEWSSFYFCFHGFKSIYGVQNHTKTKKNGKCFKLKNGYWVGKWDKYLNHPHSGRIGYQWKIKGNKPLGGAKFFSGLSWKCILTGHNALCQFYDPLGLRDWLSTIGFLNGSKQVMFGLQSTLFHKIYDIEMLIYGKKTKNGIFTRISETF